MTSRERVQAALEHRQPDCVPVDFGATMETGMAASVVSRLRRALGLSDPDERVRVIEQYQMLGEVKDDLRKALGVDCAGIFNLGGVFGYPNADWKPWELFDGTSVLVPGGFTTETADDGAVYMYPEGDATVPPSAMMPPGGYYFDAIPRQRPLEDRNPDPADNLEEFGPFGDDNLVSLEHQSKLLHETTGYSLVYSFYGTSFNDVGNVPAPQLKNPKGIREVDEWYMSLVSRKDYILEVFDGMCEIGLENLKRVHEAVGERIDVIKITGADFGTQRGPLISPDMYREMIKPFHARLCNWIHEHTSWKVFMHSCGGIRPLLDDIVESGIDIISPVQCSAEGMDAASLKADYGDRLVFWGGGVDTQRTLPFGTPGEVYDEVAERIRIFNAGGGYVFNAIHNIQAGTPVDNILAMFRALDDVRTCACNTR